MANPDKSLMNQTKEPKGYISALIEMLQSVDVNVIEEIVQVLLEAYHQGKQVFIFGNGGSGTTASHMTGDFIKGVSYGLEKKFKIICLNDNYTTLTAFANDVSYDLVFVEPLKNFLRPGDIVIGLSGSGNSRNVVAALEHAKQAGARVVSFSGYSGGRIKDLADISVYIPIHSMEVTEDIHLSVLHMIKNRIIDELHGGLGLNLGQEYLNRI